MVLVFTYHYLHYTLDIVLHNCQYQRSCKQDLNDQCLDQILTGNSTDPRWWYKMCLSPCRAYHHRPYKTCPWANCQWLHPRKGSQTFRFHNWTVSAHFQPLIQNSLAKNKCPCLPKTGDESQGVCPTQEPFNPASVEKDMTQDTTSKIPASTISFDENNIFSLERSINLPLKWNDVFP